MVWRSEKSKIVWFAEKKDEIFSEVENSPVKFSPAQQEKKQLKPRHTSSTQAQNIRKNCL